MQAEIFRKKESPTPQVGVHDIEIPRGMYILDINNNVFKTTAPM
jgi:hypothetical protein